MRRVVPNGALVSMMGAPVIAGAESYSYDGGPGGVLVLHGFTGTPFAVRPLAEAMAQSGLTVDLPLLPGHGTAVGELVPKRWADFTAAAEEALGALCDRCRDVAVVGLSMGGTLACWLAERHRRLRGLVVVNPLVEPPAQSFRELLRAVLDEGSDIAPGVGSDIAKEGVDELAYEGTPLAATLSLFEGVDDVAAGLERIACPVLLFSSREDHVVAPTSGDVLVAGAHGVPVDRVWLERSFHVATLDHDALEIIARTVAFVRRVLGEPAVDAAAVGVD